MLTENDYQIRRLPDYVGVAPNMDCMFLPSECKPGEVIVRRGMINHGELGYAGIVMAYCRDEGIAGLSVYIRRDGKWCFEMGGTSCQADRAIRSVIGEST